MYQRLCLPTPAAMCAAASTIELRPPPLMQVLGQGKGEKGGLVVKSVSGNAAKVRACLCSRTAACFTPKNTAL